MDLNRVDLFVRVVEAGSFSAAARTLGLPVSSISRAVARLEEDLGVRLLQRTTRKLALTEAGRPYFDRMQTVLTEAEAATDAVAGQSRAPTGTVRITAPAAGLLGLPTLLARIARTHPGLEIDLTLTTRSLDLLEEGIDLAIRGGRLPDSTMVARRIGSNDFGVVAAPSYLERRGTPRAAAELIRHDCLRLRTRGGLLPWRFDRGKALPVTGPLVCDDITVLYEATLGGAGLGYLPLEVLARDLRAGRLVRVLPRHRTSGGALYVLWPSQRLLPARVVLVRDLLIQGLTKALSGPT
jgi:DNA-binding transcriptional LysR family regulator